MTLGAFTGYLDQKIPMGAWIAHVVDFAVSFGVITALFAAARSGRAAEASFSNWPPAHERRTLGP